MLPEIIQDAMPGRFGLLGCLKWENVEIFMQRHEFDDK